MILVSLERDVGKGANGMGDHAEYADAQAEAQARMLSPVSDRKARIVAFRAPRLHWALTVAARWLEDHSFGGEPQAITIEHGPSDDADDRWEGGWWVQVICDV